ncbi:TetR/AcrR family transcriptional regulator [Streptomyces paludis]|uniref:TetR/AcrR family transcriptional regulator n=1 Tax=Streptomyces paludis TaxID=2282738 RepID=A0A345HR17_9ACTN|nr:TetR/AcrR family transcriptional regulator [Streptomyces paludis]AXG79141.1 TetR/AcrR family transcriptional regulator [Streptomyces paludis]
MKTEPPSLSSGNAFCTVNSVPRAFSENARWNCSSVAQGINRTGMDQLCAVAQVSKRTAYQHFSGKDDLVAEYLRRFDPDVMAGVFDRTDLTPRERLLAVFEVPTSGPEELTPLCPYIAATVEIHDPEHPASQYARDYKLAIAARLAETAREAGAPHPEQLGEQLALLLDGASARTRVLNAESFPTAAAIATILINNALPTPPWPQKSKTTTA